MTCPRCTSRAFLDDWTHEHYCLLCGWRSTAVTPQDVLDGPGQYQHTYHLAAHFSLTPRKAHQ